VGEKAMNTEFAPAERSNKSETEYQSKLASAVEHLQYFFNSMPDVFLVLNKNRQIVLGNKTALHVLEVKDLTSILGLRPGEALGCENASKSEGGCGTTIFCKYCGAVNAILSGLKGEEDYQECHITQKSGGTLDFRAYTLGTKYDGEQFCALIMTDISSEKRKNALERVFFHDIVNSLGALRVFAELLKEAPDPQKAEEISNDIYGLTNRILDEVNAQRDLIKAENDELSIHPTPVSSLGLLHEVRGTYEKHDLAIGRDIVVDPGAEEVELTSDKTLLRRVLGNMVKNALEASASGETITLCCTGDGEGVQFSVHNPGSIPDETQLEIFKPYFSTKDSARGLGTYSMRLLSERYLNGSVSFSTSEAEGTTFFTRYPLVLNQ